MKKFFYIIILSGIVGLSSCDYLDVVPEDNATIEDAFTSPDKALSFMYSIYGHLPNNIQHFMPGQSMGGDDLMSSCKGTTRWFAYKSMMYGEESSSTVYHNFMRHTGASSGGVNYDYYTAIRYAYTLLNNIDRVSNLDPALKEEWKGEAWYLIGYFHWAMLEYYGPIVIVDKEIPLAASEDELYVSRNTFDECVNFIVSCFDKAIASLPARQKNEMWFGRASGSAAHGFKVRTLLFAASPLFNGNKQFYSNFKNPDGTHLVNQTYDKSKWERAMIAAQEAIAYAEANEFKLYRNPANSGLSDFERGVKDFHDYFVEPTYNTDEYLSAYVHPSSHERMQQKSGLRSTLPYISEGFTTDYQVLFPAVEMYYTKNGLPLADDPDTKNLNLYEYDPVAETAVLNLNREPRFYACVGYNRGEFDIDNQTKIVKAYAGEVHGYTMNGNSIDNSKEYNNSTGYFFKKPIHKITTYDATTKKFTYKKWTYPTIRLAEIYLSYAEADFEYNGSLSATSLQYLNEIRDRCGLPKFEDSWALAGGIPTGEKLREVVRMERNNELMFEGHRYRDMRRWMEAEKCMTSTWKAWNVWGTDAPTYYKVRDFYDFEQKRRVFETPRHYLLPYPLNEIQINGNLVQNPGW